MLFFMVVVIEVFIVVVDVCVAVAEFVIWQIGSWQDIVDSIMDTDTNTT